MREAFSQADRSPRPVSTSSHDGGANRMPEVGRAEAKSAIHILRCHKVPRSMPALRDMVAKCLRFDRQAARAA